MADTLICALHSNELSIGRDFWSDVTFIPISSLTCSSPVFFLLTDNGRNIKGNQQQLAASWTYASFGTPVGQDMYNAQSLLLCMNFSTEDFCWMQMPLWMTDSVFVSSRKTSAALIDVVWVYMTGLTLASRSARAQWREHTLTRARACMKQHFLFLSCLLSIEENQWSFPQWNLPLSLTSVFLCTLCIYAATSK